MSHKVAISIITGLYRLKCTCGWSDSQFFADLANKSRRIHYFGVSQAFAEAAGVPPQSIEQASLLLGHLQAVTTLAKEIACDELKAPIAAEKARKQLRHLEKMQELITKETLCEKN